MKTVLWSAVLALFLLSLIAPHMVTAGNREQWARGNYVFLLDDEHKKHVEFEAVKDESGVTRGRMSFTDEAPLEDQDVDGTGEKPPEGSSPFFMAEFDEMTVEENRAVMNGIIRDSSHRDYIERFIQLVVVDNKRNLELPDQIVWAICKMPPGGWVPEDAEVPGDRGAYMSWWATDAERKYDVGIPSPNLIPGGVKYCRTYPLSAYEFASILKADGDIEVQP